MKLSALIKDALGWYFLLLFLTLFVIAFGGRGFLALLRFVLESLNSFGAA